MNIGIIKYRSYEERVLMDANFSIDELFRIILEDEDFVWFNIADPKGNVLLSTWYPDTKKGARYIEVLKVRKHEELIRTDYYAYRTPRYIYRTRVKWYAGVYRLRTKKEAKAYSEKTNRITRELIQLTIK